MRLFCAAFLFFTISRSSDGLICKSQNRRLQSFESYFIRKVRLQRLRQRREKRRRGRTDVIKPKCYSLRPAPVPENFCFYCALQTLVDVTGALLETSDTLILPIVRYYFQSADFQRGYAASERVKKKSAAKLYVRPFWKRNGNFKTDRCSLFRGEIPN